MQDYFSKMQGMKGGPAPQPAPPAPAPAPGPMPGPMPGEMPQKSSIDLNKASSPEGKKQQQAAMIFAKVEAALQEMGYYDLPENQGRGAEIQKEIEVLVQAIIEDDAETLKESEIYSFITSRKGQREALREKAPNMADSGGPSNGTQG